MAAVEFAIIAMLLFTMLFGIIEGGWVFFNWVVITNEAREGARWGAVRWGDPGCTNVCIACADGLSVRDRFASRMSGLVGSSVVTFTCSANSSTVTVTVNDTVPIITPLMQAAFRRSSFVLQATSTMRSE